MNKMNCNKGNDTKINQMENCYKQFSGTLENREVNNYIKIAIENKEIALGLIARATGCVQSQLKEQGFQSFPVFTFVGEPGAGKTVIAEAIMESPEGEIDAAAKMVEKRKWEEKIHNCTDNVNLVVMDDVRKSSDLLSSNRSIKNADEFLRNCFKGQLPIGVLTVESEAFKELIESSIDRMLICPVGSGFLKDNEISSVLSWMSSKEGKECLKYIFSEFSSQADLKDAKDRLQEHRKKYKDLDRRRMDMNFLAEYMSEKFIGCLCKLGIDVDNSGVLKNLEEILEWNKLKKRDDEDLVYLLLEKVLQSNAKNIFAPCTVSLCSEIFSGSCRTESQTRLLCGDGRCDKWLQNCNTEKIEKYYPLDCIHDVEKHYGVLFESVKDVYRFSYEKFSDSFQNESLLIIPEEILLRLINNQLNMYCMQNNIVYPEYKSKQLLKILWNRNMILYRVQENGSLRYTFPHLAFVEEKYKASRNNHQNSLYENEKKVQRVNRYVWLRVPHDICEKIICNADRKGKVDYGSRNHEEIIQKYNDLSNEWSVLTKGAGAPGTKSEF